MPRIVCVSCWSWLSPHLLPRSDSNSSSINTILLSVDVDVNVDVIVEAIRLLPNPPPYRLFLLSFYHQRLLVLDATSSTVESHDDTTGNPVYHITHRPRTGLPLMVVVVVVLLLLSLLPNPRFNTATTTISTTTTTTTS